MTRIISNGTRGSSLVPVLVHTLNEPNTLHEIFQVRRLPPLQSRAEQLPLGGAAALMPMALPICSLSVAQVKVVCSLRGVLEAQPRPTFDEASLRHVRVTDFPSLHTATSFVIDGCCRLEPLLGQVAGCVLSILSELHEAHIMFRGVCPSFLYLNSNGQVVALDYRCVGRACFSSAGWVRASTE